MTTMSGFNWLCVAGSHDCLREASLSLSFPPLFLTTSKMLLHISKMSKLPLSRGIHPKQIQQVDVECPQKTVEISIMHFNECLSLSFSTQNLMLFSSPPLFDIISSEAISLRHDTGDKRERDVSLVGSRWDLSLLYSFLLLPHQDCEQTFHLRIYFNVNLPLSNLSLSLSRSLSPIPISSTAAAAAAASVRDAFTRDKFGD
jgi:hypothetical protein